MGRQIKINDLLNKLEAEEKAFRDTEFFAPVLPGGRVQVRISGLVYTLRVKGRVEPGWAILKPSGIDAAQMVGKPTLQQIRQYLELFPALPLILLSRLEHGWLGVSAQKGDRRIQIPGPVPIQLAVGVEPFQRVVVRFDGVHFWFQELDRRRNPAIAAYLRASLAAEIRPDSLRKPTLTAEEREAYRILYESLEVARRDRVDFRLSEALAHAGAELSSYIELDDAYTVTFNIDDRPYRSTVRKDDLTVLAAGICLSGQDRHFDLQSLVGVIREGVRGHQIHAVDGQGDWFEEM